MSDDDVERTLREAFAARADASVSDTDGPPPPRFAGAAAAPVRRRRARLFAPLAAAAAVLAVVGGIVAIAGSNDAGSGRDVLAGGPSAGRTATASGAPTTAAPSGPTPTTVAPPAPAQAVRIKLLNADGITYGVGMPVIAYFSRSFTTGGSLAAATSVTVNGKPVSAAWYFERSTAFRDYPIEGHLRMRDFWPAHAKVTVAVAATNVAAGRGMAFENAVQVTFRTGASRVAIVSDKSHRLTLLQDGKKLASYPVSLGARATPTTRGTKVVMSQGAPLCMSGPGYHECGVEYTQRVTRSGEYLVAAPWNTYNIEHGIDSSNGCTNLRTQDARALFNTMRVGDVVEYPDANGPPMTTGIGYGDWDVPWSVWRQGGLIGT